MMNTIQKRILIAGAVLVCLACLYVPWTYSIDRDGGYALIFFPPKWDQHNSFRAKPDVMRMLPPIAAIVVATGVGIFLAKDTRLPAPSDAIQDLSR